MDDDVPSTIWSEDDISPEFLPPPTLLDCKVGRLVRLRLIVSCTTELSSLNFLKGEFQQSQVHIPNFSLTHS